MINCLAKRQHCSSVCFEYKKTILSTRLTYRTKQTSIGSKTYTIVFSDIESDSNERSPIHSFIKYLCCDSSSLSSIENNLFRTYKSNNVFAVNIHSQGRIPCSLSLFRTRKSDWDSKKSIYYCISRIWWYFRNNRFSRILVSSFISINSRCRREMGASQSTYDEDDYDNNYGEEDNEEMPVNVHSIWILLLLDKSCTYGQNVRLYW